MPRAFASAANDDGPAATSSTSRLRSAARSSAKNCAYSASVRPKNETAGSSSGGVDDDGLGNRRGSAAGGGGSVSVGMGDLDSGGWVEGKFEKQKTRLGWESGSASGFYAAGLFCRGRYAPSTIVAEPLRA